MTATNNHADKCKKSTNKIYRELYQIHIANSNTISSLLDLAAATERYVQAIKTNCNLYENLSLSSFVRSGFGRSDICADFSAETTTIT